MGEMLTTELLFGLNGLSLAGFAFMFAALSLTRQPRQAKIWSILLMVTGTIMLFAGLYLRAPAS